MAKTFGKLVDDSRYYVIEESQTELQLNGPCSGNRPDAVWSSYSAAVVDDFGSLVEVRIA